MPSDHIGLVEAVIKKDSKIYMSEIDYNYITTKSDSYWKESDKKISMDGFPNVNSINWRKNKI